MRITKHLLKYLPTRLHKYTHKRPSRHLCQYRGNKVFAASTLLALLSAGHSQAADLDGCWSGYHEDGGSCVELASENLGSRIHLSLKNRCDQRLYLTWCAGDKCGSESLRPNQTMNKYVYGEGNQSKVYAVGSNNPTKDSTCRDRIGRW